MNGHVGDWLPAYHDGELHGPRLEWVEAHLKDCAACRHELDGLRVLSALLKAAPEPVRHISAGRFLSQVELRLNEPAPRPGWGKALEAGWRLAPLGLLFAWGFSQAVLVLSGLVAAQGGFESILAGEFSLQELLLSLPLGFNLSTLFRWIGAFPWLGWQEPLYGLILLELGLAVVIGVLLWGWVASFWVYQQRRLIYADKDLRNEWTAKPGY